jgi:hypothetical protein
MSEHRLSVTHVCSNYLNMSLHQLSLFLAVSHVTVLLSVFTDGRCNVCGMGEQAATMNSHNTFFLL